MLNKLDESWINKARSKGNPVKSTIYLNGIIDYHNAVVSELQKLSKDLQNQGDSQYIGVLRALTKVKQLKSK